ncbi:XRE family transcriptional regulator [Streptomyces sp. NPDC015131]|uniref:helix-turn-helix domain-containing protein n=1 Tax=Streptomyces sp. NPDC015131 TaxID=3364941 RepID=UPI0036F79BE5
MGANAELRKRMSELGLKREELAGQMNDELLRLTGRPGSFTARSIHNLLSGKTQRPATKTCVALEAVFGCAVSDLGFRPPSTAAAPREASVHRRRFVTAAGAAVAAATMAPATSPHRIGTRDVERLQHRFAEIIASDHRHGGQLGIEQRAASLAAEALQVQRTGGASQRVRNQLYGCAAAFRSSAMWAAIDGRRFDRALAHMREAQQLAEMSGDPYIKFRIWSHAGTLYRHMGRSSDAAAANEVARSLSLTRRDPMFASLGLARQAAIYGIARDATAARRAFDQAQEAMRRADPHEYRPAWMNAFYDQAELDSLALSAYLTLGDCERAEAHGHRCLAGLRPHMHRSRAIATARLARAQLAQGDVEPALATAMAVPADSATQHPRVVALLHRFGAELTSTAPGTQAASTWSEYQNDIGGRS